MGAFTVQACRDSSSERVRASSRRKPDGLRSRLPSSPPPTSRAILSPLHHPVADVVGEPRLQPVTPYDRLADAVRAALLVTRFLRNNAICGPCPGWGPRWHLSVGGGRRRSRATVAEGSTFRCPAATRHRQGRRCSRRVLDWRGGRCAGPGRPAPGQPRQRGLLTFTARSRSARLQEEGRGASSFRASDRLGRQPWRH
jgi:hypothetical protein